MAANLDLTQYRAEDVRGTKRVISGIYTGPASYSTGGDALAPGEVKLGQLHFFAAEVASNGTDLRLVKYDYATEKVKWFDLAGAEIANGANLSAYSCRFEAVGL